MIRVGIIGVGFMGHMHFRCWKANANAEIVAVCDVDNDKFTGKAAQAGNIEGAEDALDFTGIAIFNDIDTMLKEAELDAVSIALPTYLHAEATIKALKAGVNVLCEKPMASDSAECQAMIDAANESGKILQIGHCIRFWPEYALVKELVESGKYGAVKIANFTRISATPTWSWQGWILDPAKAGGSVHDLHIHDADFVQYLFGLPKAVFSQMVKGYNDGPDHAVTQYIYENGPVVTAEGGWLFSNSFGFKMAFHIVMEKATITFDITQTPTIKIHPVDDEAFTPELAQGDGYSIEIEHFTKRVLGQDVPEILTSGQSLDSVKLIEAEKKSAETTSVVELD